MESSAWDDRTTSLSLGLHVGGTPPRFPTTEAPRLPIEANFMDNGLRSISIKQEAGALEEELSRMSEENKRLNEVLSVMCENYSALQSRLMDLMNNNNTSSSDHHQLKASPSPSPSQSSKKRKSSPDNCCAVESTSSEGDSGGGGNINNNNKPKGEEEPSKIKISKAYVRTSSSDTTLVVKDGYQWRKYGQKVTRDNPSPRAYFRCSFAPVCPVKKKVQRSAEDPSVLVATYEGEHNHPHPSQAAEAAGSTTGPIRPISAVPPSPSMGSTVLNSAACGPTVTLDLTRTAGLDHHHLQQPRQQHQHQHDDHIGISTADIDAHRQMVESPQFQQLLVEQMASSLTKDPNFTAALATALSGRILRF